MSEELKFEELGQNEYPREPSNFLKHILKENHSNDIQRIEKKLDELIEKINRIELLIIRASDYKLSPYIEVKE